MDFFADLPEAQLINAICHAPIFSGIGLPEQKMLAEKSVINHCDADEILIEQGDLGDKLYILIEGSMLVSVKDLNVGQKRINTLGPGDVFGEIAIIRKIPRTARVTSITPCTFLTINSEDFYNAYLYFPAKARDNIQLVIAKRLKELEHRSH